MDRSLKKIFGKFAVTIYYIIAKGIVEFNVAFHETYGIDKTRD